MKKGTPDPNAQPRAAAHEAQPGDAMPDVALVDQDGRPLRLARPARQGGGPDLRLHPLPAARLLPAHDEELRGAREALLVADRGLADAHAPPHGQLRPEHDTPEVLRPFGKPFQKTTPALHALVARHRQGRGDPERSGEALELDYVEETGPSPTTCAPRSSTREGKLRRLLPRQRVDAGGAGRRAAGGRRPDASVREVLAREVARARRGHDHVVLDPHAAERRERVDQAPSRTRRRRAPVRKGRSSIGMK